MAVIGLACVNTTPAASVRQATRTSAGDLIVNPMVNGDERKVSPMMPPRSDGAQAGPPYTGYDCRTVQSVAVRSD
jgi:hypothetical protein